LSYCFFSPLGKLAGRAIYFACVNFLFFIFLFFFTMSKAISVSTGPIFTIFHQMKGICVNFLDQVQFFRFLKGRCHGNQFCFVPDLFTRSRSISGSAGTIFKFFAPYGRYRIADDQYDLSFSDILRNIAMGTNFVAKLPTPLHLSFCHFEKEWDMVARCPP